MKKVIREAFEVFGMLFLVLLIWSYFDQNGDTIYQGKTFLIVFLLALIFGGYLREVRRKK
ncbi:hypothetical protein HCJ66_12135 [Listeria sp. FSL L7-1582]|uniref:Uncharacterized protein n=1 Tax=Listeria rustica TaxID=2713503 RepID=A0A7W1T503_9LIST|nr:MULTISPECIES: hypothetical protein [Listeria]MBA3925585.1 hypothetical protein [Listeria rustica]MBC6310288.1 hypothetical protein [Listeria portnoyi]